MRALYVTSEVYPLAKTGGLADVSAALPAALEEFGIDTRVLVPGYPQALAQAPNLTEVARLGDPLGCGEARLLQTHLPNSKIPVWLIDCPALYNRSGGFYQRDDGEDWPDNALRFALLNHVAAGIANEPGGSWRPDVIHANDWHAGLVPLLLSPRQGPRPAVVFTIHNLAYQGLFSTEVSNALDLPADTLAAMEYYGRISFLKAGIQGADAITTVSPTYASEILTSEYGCGLDGLLREKSSRLTGILNGADYGVWDPALDPALASNFSMHDLAGKLACKNDVQDELGLIEDGNVPLIAFLSRLAHQKMPDVVLDALPALLERNIQFALVAEGDNGYENRFRQLAANHPGRVAVRIGYSEPIAHRLLAGADMLLHPARFEPCGLVPIYAMRYGTIPLVRASGGMADSVVDATQRAIQKGTATGFAFQDATAEDLIHCADRALATHKQAISWRKIQNTGMRQDFSWRSSAQAYANLYRSLAGRNAVVENAAQPQLAKLSA
jgi:starch synthase